MQRKRDKEQGIKRYTVEEWNAGALAVPGGNLRPRQNQRTTDEITVQKPDFRSKYPVAVFDSENHADAVCKALQNRVNELKSGALAKTRLDDESEHFAITNPWFSVVADADLAPDELISVRDKLDRLFEPLGPVPTLEEALLHAYLPALGEKLICLQNNAKFNLFNGQECRVVGFCDERPGIIELELEIDDGRLITAPCLARQFGVDMIREHRDKSVLLMDFGYVLTVHKAQGSAWEEVLVLESIASSWDARRWRYTAVTRAINRLVYCV